MKKIVVSIVLIFVLIAGTFAQNILDIDGNQWYSWTTLEKQKYVLGWYASLASLQVLLNDLRTKSSIELTEQTLQMMTVINNWSVYQHTVGDLVKLLDRTYENPEARRFKIWDVLLTVTEKEWW